ncbi:hypothetical protein AB1Y20_007754 [Prymnesium parvum]|uniref:Uncharacterized protein n=1 Tax=Prymnesium parvum TaxID=97485 RepID=A0AB34IUN1_PRYPA|mmetsp:Transcript_440/g.1225  ORF Transcript_440/g.1225 Transcript_440/m.1225 type:complete len:210 (+) Transcript_440:96-725(+)
MELDAAMARMGLSVPDHLKPAVQAKQEPKKLTVKEQKALDEKLAEEKRRKKAAKMAALAGGGSADGKEKEKDKKDKVPAKKKEEKKEAPPEKKEEKKEVAPSKEVAAAWNEVGKVKVGAAMEDGPVMPYMKYDLPWMKYTARTKEQLEAVAREKEAELERAAQADALAKEIASREAEAAEVRGLIGKGKLSLNLVEWQTIFIASNPPCA